MSGKPLSTICSKDFCQLGMSVIEIEGKEILSLSSRIDARFAQACQTILACEGKVVVIGMGKSGHIANKIAATMASTGTPAFFVHPGEASHGDMGMITSKDVIVALSNSGETNEILTIVPLIKRRDIQLIALTGNKNSSLAKAADIHIDVSIELEACPLGLAPTSSTTAALVMGDALAIALLKARGFTQEDFALSHPGGLLGRRLLIRVEDIMRSNDQVPIVSMNVSLAEALFEMSQKGMGMTAVVDTQNRLIGVFTDGDLRRTLDKKLDIKTTPIHEVMTKSGKTILPKTLAVEALNMMQNHKITTLLVTNENQHPIAALHLHDILRAGVC